MAMPCCCSMTNVLMHTVYLGLGSNMGDRQATLLKAYAEIEKLIGTIVRQSAFIISEPWGFETPHIFLNSVICCETKLNPFDVLWETQAIERRLGRTQKSIGGLYNDRPIDIDILLYDQLQLHTPLLTIPHPLMLQRSFVLQPLLEIMPFGDGMNVGWSQSL